MTVKVDEAITALDAPFDETDQGSDTEFETVRDPSQIKDADSEAAKAAAAKAAAEAKNQDKPVVVDAEAITQNVLNGLLKLGNQHQQQQRQQGPSPLQVKVKELLDAKVPEDNIRRFLELHQAATQETLNAQQQQAHAAQVQAYNAGLVQMSHDAIEEVAGSIKPIANNPGLRADLIQRMAAVVASDPKYGDIKNAIDSFGMPSKNRLKEVAAKVSDQWCLENGITKPQAGLDIKSSKPEPSDAHFDPNNLGRAARQIYDLTLKYTKDPKKARQRALSVK